MARLTGPVYVPAPNPVLPRYGLFNVATGPLDLPINARSGGLQYQLSTCDLPDGYEVACQDATDPVGVRDKDLDNPIDTIVGDPFIVYSSIECSPVGLANLGQEAINKYLFQQLVAGEQAVVERIFSTGEFGQSPSLAGATNLGTAQGPVQAVSKLESWLYARYGLPGVIHAPIAAQAYLMGAYTMEMSGNYGSEVWRTPMHTSVSFGNYSGVGPTGQVPSGTNVWIYITGQVAIWRTPDSELFVPPFGQVINRATNVLNMVMEREYVLSFDCYSAAVEVTLNTTDR